SCGGSRPADRERGRRASPPPEHRSLRPRRASEEKVRQPPPAAASLWARRWPRIYLAGLAALALVACFLPLADHLGYELAELVALAAGALGAAPGIAAARLERDSSTRALSRALWFGLWALAIPLGIILLNGLRRPACDPFAALPLYLLLTVPSAALSCTLGVAC